MKPLWNQSSHGNDKWAHRRQVRVTLGITQYPLASLPWFIQIPGVILQGQVWRSVCVFLSYRDLMHILGNRPDLRHAVRYVRGRDLCGYGSEPEGDNQIVVPGYKEATESEAESCNDWEDDLFSDQRKERMEYDLMWAEAKWGDEDF